jgi:hypothetical protein
MLTCVCRCMCLYCKYCLRLLSSWGLTCGTVLLGFHGLYPVSNFDFCGLATSCTVVLWWVWHIWQSSSSRCMSQENVAWSCNVRVGMLSVVTWYVTHSVSKRGDDSVVGIETGLEACWCRIFWFLSGTVDSFSCPQHSGWLWGLLNILFSGYQGPLLREQSIWGLTLNWRLFSAKLTVWSERVPILLWRVVVERAVGRKRG